MRRFIMLTTTILLLLGLTGCSIDIENIQSSEAYKKTETVEVSNKDSSITRITINSSKKHEAERMPEDEETPKKNTTPTVTIPKEDKSPENGTTPIVTTPDDESAPLTPEEAQELVTPLMNMMFRMMRISGIMITIMGLYSIVIGLLSEGMREERTARGFLNLIAGIICITLPTFVKAFIG